MADITMCSGKGCRVKDKCYRFTANKNEFRQSYFTKPPINVKDNVLICDYFWGKCSSNIIEEIFKTN